MLNNVFKIAYDSLDTFEWPVNNVQSKFSDEQKAVRGPTGEWNVVSAVDCSKTATCTKRESIFWKETAKQKIKKCDKIAISNSNSNSKDRI